MAMVRTYLSTNNGNAACWQQAPWGMVALHIIQKTPTAPYFIYATFSQADNILDSNGKPVEDENGNMINTNPGPNLDSGYPGPPNPIPPNPQNPITATMATPTTNETFNVTTAKCVAGPRLYLVNSSGATPQGPICVNQRTHPIPQTIIDANTTAHAAITAYNATNNGGKTTPWLYYKLVNVQAAPINKPVPGTVYTGADSATYYQSNDVVETNYNLQFFSGRLVSHPPFNPPYNGLLISDFTTDPFSPPPPSAVFQNVFYLQNPNGSPVTTFNMGGCMGCHGNAQQAGDNFSFILNVGRNDAPEPLPAPTATAQAVQSKAVAAKVRKFTLPQPHYNLPSK